MSQLLRIGIMGGHRGSSFAAGLKAMKGVQFTALCEQNDAVIENIRDRLWRETKVFQDFDEFIHCGLDAVILCNYFHEHGIYAMRALEAGIAVLSETTAAPSLGQCVDLVETCEKYNGRYMLAANCLYFKAVHAMKKRIESGNTGRVLYADAEYIHGSFVDYETTPMPEIDYDNLHWRKIMPVNMYNMHTLGPLMYVTDSMPCKVSCKMIRDEPFARVKGRVHDCVGAVVVTEMSNGAVFNTTGCSCYPPTSKWYRIACEKETLETVRYDQKEEELIIASEEGIQRLKPTDEEAGLADKDINPEDVAAASHGGLDYYVLYHFLAYLRGEKEPYFDVYRSAALSAVGILGWYSALMDSAELKVPDFHNKEERDAVRGDDRSPIVRKYSERVMPCRIDEKESFVR